MQAFIQAALEAVTAFSATNIDDLFILMMLFSSDVSPKNWQVVCGQYVGIGLLVGLSLLSLFGRVALPDGLIGLLGLFPVSLGLSQLGETCVEKSMSHLTPPHQVDSSLVGGVFAGIFGVTSLTLVNGSDNISVYAAMLASSDPFRLRVILLMFAILTGFWCLLAWWLTRVSFLAAPLRRFQRDFAPLFLMGIGALVLVESHTFAHPLLAFVALLSMAVMVISLAQQLRTLLVADRHSTLSPR